MPFRPTFGQFRQSRYPTRLGECAADIAGLAAIVNEAQEKLIMDPLAPDEGWWGGWVKMVFSVAVSNFNGSFITPREIARVILLDVCQQPVKLRNGFYEYLEFGIGLQPSQCPTCNPQSNCGQVLQAYERDSVASLTDFPTTPQFIRAFAVNSADIGRRVVFQGADQNGMTIYGVDINTQSGTQGETVYIANPFIQAVNKFTSLTGILKEITVGPVQIFTVDPISGTQTLLTTLQPGETSSTYRKYFVNGLPLNCCNTPNGIVTVTAQCKLDFIPVQNDQDFLIIQSIPAVGEECESIRYSSMDEAKAVELEAKHHAKALAILNGQLDHYLGKTSPVVRVSLFGSDRLRPNPI